MSHRAASPKPRGSGMSPSAASGTRQSGSRLRQNSSGATGPKRAPSPSGRSPVPENRGGGASGGGAKAIQITGFTGHYSLINGIYEPLKDKHHNYPCWANTSPTSRCVLFHTAKARWVVSQDLDDGLTCYAYISDNSGGKGNPAACTGPWTSYNHASGKWEEQAAIRCTARAASDPNDPFQMLNAKLKDELDKVGVTDVKRRASLWQMVDRSGDGFVDLIEIEALIEDMTKTGNWPKWLKQDSLVIKLAYDKALEEDLDGDGNIDKDEFQILLANVFWFCKLWSIYVAASGTDDTMTKEEFVECMRQLGCNLDPNQASMYWSEIDLDRNNNVDFPEFCNWMRIKVCGENSEPITDAADKHVDAAQGSMSSSATSGAVVRKKQFVDFDELEDKIRASCKDNKKIGAMWKTLDFNGNGYASLAEIDKWCVERYPLLNHKPATMRAYQASKNADGNQTGYDADYITKKEFKLLILKLFYYNKIYWIFEQATGADHGDTKDGRRMDFEEFKMCLFQCGAKMGEKQAKAEFDKVDTNHGGQILFDEFCEYFVSKQCPSEMLGGIA